LPPPREPMVARSRYASSPVLASMQSAKPWSLIT